MPVRGTILSAYRRPRHLPDGFSQKWGYPSALSSLLFRRKSLEMLRHFLDISLPKVSAPPGHRRRADHCLAAVSLASSGNRLETPIAGRSYSPGGPTPMRFRSVRCETTSTWATLPYCRISNTWPTKPGTGYHAGPYSTSRVSLVLHSNGHVAIRSYPENPVSYVRFSRSGIVSAAPSLNAER